MNLRKIASISMALWVLTTSIGIAKFSFICLQGPQKSVDCCSESDNKTEGCCSGWAQTSESCCALEVEVFQTNYICFLQNEVKSYDFASLPIHLPGDPVFVGNDPDLNLKCIGCDDPPWLYQPPIHLRIESFLI